MYIRREEVPEKPDDAEFVWKDVSNYLFKGNQVWSYDNNGELIKYAKYRSEDDYNPFDMGRPFDKIYLNKNYYK